MKRISLKAIGLAIVLISTITSILYLEGFITGELRAGFSQGYELEGIEGWINSEPLTLASLRGKVVLVDFWTYSCINCIRTFPYLNAWHEKYSDSGFVILGVHSPEFSFEKEIENVREATERFGLRFPVAIDNEHRTFTAFGNRFWPHKYLFDASGNLRYDHIGEGAYEETENKIRSLLTEIDIDVSGIPLEAEKKFSNPALGEAQRDITRELYALRDVMNRGLRFAGMGLDFMDDGKDHLIDGIYLNGLWKTDGDHFRYIGKEGNGFFQISYYGGTASPVIGSLGGKSLVAYVLLDGRSVPRELAGPDLKFDEKGTAFVMIEGPPRLYSLVNASVPLGRHELRVETRDEGLSIWSVTFGG